jgi:hypothetical protein
VLLGLLAEYASCIFRLLREYPIFIFRVKVSGTLAVAALLLPPLPSPFVLDFK